MKNNLVWGLCLGYAYGVLFVYSCCGVFLGGEISLMRMGSVVVFVRWR